MDYIAQKPEPKKKGKDSTYTQPKISAPAGDAMADWMLAYKAASSASSTASPAALPVPKRSLAVPAEREAMEADDPGSDVDLDAAYEQLLAKKTELADRHQAHPCSFVVIVRHDPEMTAKTGKGFDTVRATHNGIEAKAWLDRHDLPLSFSMATKSRDAADCDKLCTEWCHRMQYFYNAWIEAGRSHDIVYDAAMIDSYAESADFSEWADDPARPKDLQARIRQLRKTYPAVHALSAVALETKCVKRARV